MIEVVLLIVAWLLIGCGIARGLGRVADCGSCSMETIAELAGISRADRVAPSRCTACLERRKQVPPNAAPHMLNLPAKPAVSRTRFLVR